MKKLILVITLMLISVAFVSGDVYIKTVTHTSAFEMMGKKIPAKDAVTEQWIGIDKMAMATAEQIMVLDMNSKKLFFIYPGKKSYLETSLPLDMAKLLPKEMAGMMGMMKMTAKVEPNGQTKTINGKKCDGYNIAMNMSMMNSKSIAWVTTDVPFDWKTYSEKMFATIMNASMPFIDAASIAEFKKMKGLQIAQEITTSMMGKEMKSTYEVTEISEKPAPAGLYSVPAGYKKVDNLIMAMGGM